MRKTLIFIIIAAVLAAGIFCPAASARYADNKGVEPGDILFLGEQGLDFSKFSTAEYTVDCMIMESGGSMTDIIPLQNEKGNIGTSLQPGIYRPYNGSTLLKTGLCKVTALESAVIGSLSVTSADGSTVPSAQPKEIPKGIGIIFGITGGEISTLENQLSGSWNNMTLKNTETAQTTSVIKNLAGTTKSLTKIAKPSNPGNSYALKLGEQTTVVPASGTPNSNGDNL